MKFIWLEFFTLMPQYNILKAMCHTMSVCLSRSARSAIEAIFLALHSGAPVWHIAFLTFRVPRGPVDPTPRVMGQRCTKG